MKKNVLLVLVPFLAACARQGEDAGFPSAPLNSAPGSQCPVGRRAAVSPAAIAPLHLNLIDSNRGAVTRHVVTERQPGGRTLLLVTEEPQDAKLAQRVVTRRSFADGDPALLVARDEARAAPLAGGAFLTITDHPVWPIDREWTSADEADYAKWIEANASEDMLKGTGIEVDCAEYAMTFRWIYSHDHHLPAADTQVGSGKLWGSWQSTAAWDALPSSANWREDGRFKAALHYALSNSYTHALFQDLYPVEILPEYVRPGTIYLTLEQVSGHTRTIYKIGHGGACSEDQVCISIIWGTLPASESGYTSTLAPYRLDEGSGGFLRFRWPEKKNGEWALRAAASMPGYSREQFTWDEGIYIVNVSNRLGLWNTPEERFAGLGESLSYSLGLRVSVTSRGYYLCSLIPCAPGDAYYDVYSTPERDAVFASQLRPFQDTYKQIDPNSETVRSFMDAHSQPVFNGAPFREIDVLLGNYQARFSSDPRVPFLRRWGIDQLSEADTLHALAKVAHDNFRDRDQLVANAQGCVTDGSPTPCDQNTLRNLSTERLDRAFVKAQAEFLAHFRAAPPETQAAIRDELRTQDTGAPFCGSGPCPANCTMDDFLVAAPEHIQKFSSNPVDSMEKRYGF
jgi:hypothetical protein